MGQRDKSGGAYWGVKGRAGQGRAGGPIQSTDSGSQAPPSLLSASVYKRRTDSVSARPESQPVDRFYDQRCRNPAQQAGRLAIQGGGCLVVICNPSTPISKWQ